MASNRRFWIYFIIIFYLATELIHIPLATLTADEFWFAHHILQYTKEIPYLSFNPYKTVIGYYLLSLPFWHQTTLSIENLYWVKYEILFLNILFIFLIYNLSKKLFNEKAIVITVAIVFLNSIFLNYSTDLRVDMLTSWLGLIAFLIIISNKSRLAGILMGVGFLISQKGIWFWAACNIAFLAEGLLTKTFRKKLKVFISFNFFSSIPILGYIIFWSIISNPTVVLDSVFYEAYTQSTITWYQKFHVQVWQNIFFSNFLLFLALPMAWLFLMIRSKNFERSIIIIFFSILIFIFLFEYQQPFPYNMVYLIPMFYLTFVEFLTQLSLQNNHKTLSIGLVILCVVGIYYPLFQFIQQSILGIASYQQSTIRTANSLLEKNDEYFAATPILFQQHQPKSLSNLIQPAVDYLYHPSKTLLPIFIASLDLKPLTSLKIINTLKNSPVKIFINNYRIQSLPQVVKDYLNTEYLRYWGSVFLYAPTISANKNFKLKFSGNYKIISHEKDVIIDKQKYSSNIEIFLANGMHQSKSQSSYRLQFIPKITLSNVDHGDLWIETVS